MPKDSEEKYRLVVTSKMEAYKEGDEGPIAVTTDTTDHTGLSYVDMVAMQLVLSKLPKDITNLGVLNAQQKGLITEDEAKVLTAI